MLVLALDTTTKGGSVAVARDGRVLDLLATTRFDEHWVPALAPSSATSR